MANRENGRGRLLCLLEILQKETDAEHGLTNAELIAKLDEAGFPVNRKTLYEDFRALEDSSIPVEKSGGRVPRYYIEDRDFEIEEIMILIDAVESAGFMTEKKKAGIIKKLKGLTSSGRASELNEQIHYIGRHHSTNNDFIYTVSALRRAMAGKHPVTFQYTDYRYGEGEILRHDGMKYILHPFAMVWSNGFYYCIGVRPEQSEEGEKDKLRHFRIDRMKKVEVLESETLVKPPKGFDVAKHMEESFSMYGSEKTTVLIRFRKDLLTQFYDRFEQNVSVMQDPEDEGYLQANVTVNVSPTFFAWIFQYEGGFSICGPKAIRDRYLEHLEKAKRA